MRRFLALLWLVAGEGTAVLAARAEDRASTPGAKAPDLVQEVVVRGQKVRPRLPPKDRSVAGSVVQGPRLRAPGASAAQLLRSEPGVGAVESGGSGALSTASIRGATAAQTPVYFGGVLLNDDVAGTADLSAVPLWLVQRIEVYRGHAPIEAGRLGIGGAIFFEPRRPTRTGGGAGAMAGSFGTRSIWLHASTGDAHSASLVGVSHDAARNDYPYTDDRGTHFDTRDDATVRRANADVSTWNVWAVGTSRLGRDGQVDIIANSAYREQGLPGLSLLPTRAARAHMGRSLFAVAVRAPCSSEGSCTFLGSSSALLARSVYQDPWREVALSGPRTDVLGDRIAHASAWQLDLTPAVSVRPSLHVAIDTLSVIAAESDATRARRMSTTPALGVEWRALPWATARMVGVAECDSTSHASSELCNEFRPTGRVGLEIGSAAVTALISLGRYTRVPTLAELYGLSAAVRGNPSLQVETCVAADLGLRLKVARTGGAFQGAYFDVFSFVRSSDSLVAYRRSSLGIIRPYNVSSARVMGLETLIGAGVFAWLDAEVAATLLDPKDTSSDATSRNRILPFRSRLVVAPSLRWHHAPQSWRGLQEAAVEVRWRYESSRYADSAGLVVIPEQSSLDVEASAEMVDRHVVLRVRAADVLDAQRYDVVGYPLAGRAFYAGGELQW